MSLEILPWGKIALDGRVTRYAVQQLATGRTVVFDGATGVALDLPHRYYILSCDHSCRGPAREAFELDLRFAFEQLSGYENIFLKEIPS